jgi:carbonic anhydrase
VLSDLLDHNVRWATGKVREDPDYFRRLSALQRPDYLWIGCSDSRVPANVITGLEPGEVFVHRNVANLVHRGDLNLLSVLEFAVETLEVQHIIVCGHYGCGGVRASILDADARLNRLCALSVAAQVAGLSRTPIIQSAWKRRRKLAVHGWIYGLDDGLIRDLECGCAGSTAGG